MSGIDRDCCSDILIYDDIDFDSFLGFSLE